MLKILHFADAHIDMANFGRHDPETGIPLRVLDFLKSLDTIVETAIQEKVDLVLFAGDAYKDRSPAPTFQREWHRRIKRLARAGIRVLLLVGNHDLSPAAGRAHAMQEYETLEVDNVHVLAKPCLLTPADLGGLPLQVIALPWIYRSSLVATLSVSTVDTDKVNESIEERVTHVMREWLDQADPALPLVLTAHASVQGAKYGAERSVMLGADWVVPPALVKDPRIDYTALGHIHRPQNLNEGGYPAVIYPGSIERVDVGEAGDEKYFVMVELERGKTRFEWRKLKGIRPMIDCYVTIQSGGAITEQLIKALPDQQKLEGAIVRLSVAYPRQLEAAIDEAALREYAAEAFEFRLVRKPEMDVRIRLPEDKAIASLTPLELLELYWKAQHIEDEAETSVLQTLAKEILLGE